MEPLQIAEKLKERFPGALLGTSEYRGQVSVDVKKESIVDLCRWLHDEPAFSMDHLRDLCGADYMGKRETRFEVVYHLYSIEHRHMLRLKAPVPEDDLRVPSVTSIWRGADWHERECFDMFGIVFEGHPNLKRILMPEGWEGYPLRKDYPLEGPALEEDWQQYKEVVEKSERLKRHEWNR